MSRNKLTDDSNFVIKLKKEFKKCSSCRELGKVLKISTSTTRRYLKDFNLAYSNGRPTSDEVPAKLTGGLAKWIKNNPDIKLPPSINEVMKITHLSKDQVKSSIYRMKLKHKNKMKELGNLHELPGALKMDSGLIFAFRDMETYRIYHSPFTEEIRINALLKNKKSVEFKTTLSKLENYKKIKCS